MPYFPLSQIKTNLYTNGYEFTATPTNTTNSYSGYYWKTSNGKYFTGKTPQDLPTQELFKIPNLELSTNNNSNIIVNITVFDGDPVVETYLKEKQINPDTINYTPYYSPQLPIPQNYQNAEFKRFFCKKTNEIIYIEIDVTQYNKLVSKNPEILWQLYEPFNITWQLTGDEQQVAKVNRNMVELTSKNLKLPSFNLYIKEDYTKYYQ